MLLVQFLPFRRRRRVLLLAFLPSLFSEGPSHDKNLGSAFILALFLHSFTSLKTFSWFLFVLDGILVIFFHKLPFLFFFYFRLSLFSFSLLFALYALIFFCFEIVNVFLTECWMMIFCCFTLNYLILSFICVSGILSIVICVSVSIFLLVID